MVRKEYPMKPRGSQRWLQLADNRRPETLNAELRRKLDLLPGESITWRSPLEEDDFAENRDEDFLVPPRYGPRALSSPGFLAYEGTSLGRSGDDRQGEGHTGRGEGKHTGT